MGCSREEGTAFCFVGDELDEEVESWDNWGKGGKGQLKIKRKCS
jgi:hypothetical protein